jgi:hypothetical protein
MVTKNDCIEVFNAMIRGTPVSFKEKLLPLYSEYLTENNFENSDKLINLVVQNPQLIQQAIPNIVEYYCRKYNILSLRERLDLNSLFNNNFKTILYYE